jgi:hypothetical protein
MLSVKATGRKKTLNSKHEIVGRSREWFTLSKVKKWKQRK